MVTKEQAIEVGRCGGELHVNGCFRKIGPKGGVKEVKEVWRPNGQCQTWKTRPTEFRLPIKYGLKTYFSMTEVNAHLFHLASECPLLQLKD